MKTTRSISRCIPNCPVYLPVATFVICFCTVLFGPTLLCAETHDTCPNTPAGDKTVSPCGLLALRTAMSLSGQSVGISKCAQLAGVDPDGRTTLAGLQTAAQALGQSTKGMHLTPQQLAFVNCPAILHVTLPNIEEHFLVFTSSDRGLFRVVDPVQSEQQNLYTAEQLRLMWNGDCLVFTPKPLLTSLEAGIWHARAIITVIIGGAVGILAGVLIASGLSRYGRSSIDAMTASGRRSAAIVLASVVLVAAVTIAIGLRAAGKRSPKAKGPRLVLGATVLNIRDLKWAEPFASSIWLGNGGSDTLIIDKKKIMTSCSCLRGAVTKSTLTKGERAKLRIRLSPPKRMGPFQYSMYIRSNDPQEGRVLTLKGRVIGPGGAVYPPRLYFGRITSNEKAQKSLVFLVRRPGVKILHAKADSSFVECHLEKRPGGFKINVSVVNPRRQGPFQGSITMVTNDPERLEIVVPFSGQVTSQTGARLQLNRQLLPVPHKARQESTTRI